MLNMLNRLINDFAERLANVFSEVSDANPKEICYGIKITIRNIPKTLCLIILALLLGLIKETLLIMLFYGAVRAFSYGFHFPSARMCFLYGTAMYILGAYLSKNVYIGHIVYICIFAAVFIIYLLYAPCGTESHPVGKQQYKRNKIITLVVILVLATVGFFSETGIRMAIIYSIVSQAINIQPLIFKLFNQKGGIIYEKKT